MMNLKTYLIHFGVLMQPLFWSFVYEFYNDKLSKKFQERIESLYGFFSIDILFLMFIFAIADTIFYYSYSFEFYKTHILLQYCFFIMFAYGCLRFQENNFIKSLCFGFLLVYLNSYLWESILHLAVYHVNIRELFNIRELSHLIVIWVFSFYLYVKDKKYLIECLYVVLFINFLFSVIYIEVFNRIVLVNWNIILTIVKGVFMFMNRWISLIFLIDMFNNGLEFKKKEKRLFFR